MTHTLPLILLTGDGSSTVSAGGLAYHSSHGAVQESLHVFIKAGFEKAVQALPAGAVLRILEVGFGTGLNALLTVQAAAGTGVKIHYTTIEKYPLQQETWRQLNYESFVGGAETLTRLHEVDWNEERHITAGFILKKVSGDLADFLSAPTLPAYGLVYYDAFAPDDQPELWTPEIFARIAAAMVAGGILSTYCAKGQVRRNMLAAGLQVARIPGPPGKREMMRAEKPL